MNLHMKNKNIKKATTFVLTTSILIGSATPIFADSNTKEEVVYVKLNENGGVNNIYVVNSFNSNESIVDYGKYSNVINLSTDDKLDYANGLLDIKTPNIDGKFYYQGEMSSTDLPWNININYYLDGKRITSEELAGKSGKLEIKIDITQNKNINEEFYNNYVLQIALSLDSDKCKNIVAEGATIASVGSNKSINYMKLPGLDASYTLTADITDFEMDEISINGMNMAIDADIDINEMTNDLDQLVDAVEAINDGTGSLKGGLDEYKAGVDELSKGSYQLKDGVSQYKVGVSSLDSGVETLSMGISKYKSGISEVYKSSNSLLSGLGEVNSGINSFESGLSQLKDGSNLYNQGLAAISKGSSAYKESLNQYSNLVKSLTYNIKSSLTEEQLEILQPELEKLEKSTEGLLAGYNLVDSGIGDAVNGYSGINTGVNDLYNNISPLSKGIDELYNGMGEFNKGVGELVKGIDGIDSGAKELKSGSSQLVSGITNIDTGVVKLSDGSNKLVNGINVLSDGASELNKGTSELNKETTSMPDEINKQIDDIKSKFSGEDFTPISFASEENKNVESVQFAMRTDGISKVESEETEKEIEIEDNQSIWQLFLNLFKKDK